jgi:hypothetical protein
MNVTISNISTVQQRGRAVATAVLRNEAGEVVSPINRLADQLLLAQRDGITIINAEETLRTLVLTMGFAA